MSFLNEQVADFDAPWTEILNFLVTFLHLFFCSFLDNVEIIVNKITSVSGEKSRG